MRLNDETAKNSNRKDTIRLFARLVAEYNPLLLDAWGKELRIEPRGWCNAWTCNYIVRSAGPDKLFNGADDLTRNVVIQTGAAPGQRGNSPLVNLVIEHDRGPFNGRAEVSGIVTDVTGARIPGAKIELREIAGTKLLQARADEQGSFVFSAVPPGRYEIRITARGFEVSSLQSTLEPRDWACLLYTSRCV